MEAKFKMNERIVIEGDGEILGRIASLAAKQGLQGKQVNVINCNKVLISGNRSYILNNYLTKRRRTKVRFPSMPEQLMKRTIRGMIDYKSGRGEIAFKKVRCYNSVPVELKGEKAIILGNKNKKMLTLKELGIALKEGRQVKNG